MSDAYTPITSSKTLATPKGHRIWTTTRKVADEFPLPEIGATLASSNFIGGFADHIILDCHEYPHPGGGKKVVVTHGTFPAGIFTEYESQAFTFPPIYPGSEFMPGGSRARQRVVPARVTYEYRAEVGDWMNAATIWDYTTPSTGPFEVRSYIAEAAGENFEAADGSSGRVGDYLNPFFIGIDTVNNLITIYDPGDLFYEIGASAPSATDYAAWVANKTELMASRTIHKWYTGYMRRTAYVRAQ